MADNHTIARPYARAVFDLAHANGRLTQWSNALSVAAAVARSDEALSFIQSPRVSEADQVEFLTGLMAGEGESYIFSGDDDAGRNFLKLLVENGRVNVLPEISGRFEELKDAIENTVDVTVTTAQDIDGDQLDSIRNALAEKLGQRINLSTAIDRDLIGGAVIRAGDMVIDGSVRTRLAQLANVLTN